MGFITIRKPFFDNVVLIIIFKLSFISTFLKSNMKRILYILVIIAVSLMAQDNNKEKKRILFLGNSITAGFGLTEEQAYPNIIQGKIDSLELNYICQNAGLSGETTSGGLRRLDWLLKQEIDILVIALGGNDGLRGIPPELSKENLEKIVGQARRKYPKIKIIITGMQAPPNMGKDFTERFKKVFEQVAKDKKTALVPFLLKDVGGYKDLNQADQMHPNIKGQKIVAENVWSELKTLLIP